LAGKSIALSEIEAGRQLVSWPKGMCSEGAIELDMALRFGFETTDDEITLPLFVGVDERGAS
jgi:hypothetical protein